MSRTGKIARLPEGIREQLNRRLRDGETGTKLVGWLNELPEVQRVLALQFKGKALNEVNLTYWKQGGYVEWAHRKEAQILARKLAEEATRGKEAGKDGGVSRQLSVIMAAEFGCVSKALLLEAEEPMERWGRLKEVLQELARLRREDHKTGRLRLDEAKHAIKWSKIQVSPSKLSQIKPIKNLRIP